MNRRGKPNQQSKELKAHWLIYVSWAVMICWAVFMLYYWQSRNLSRIEESETVQMVEKTILNVEKSLENELKHIRVPVAPNLGGGSSSHTVYERDRDSKSGPVSTNSQPSWDINNYELHVIFSTDCKPYQDWQSLVLFHSATVVKQIGPITRIASGCTPEKEKELTALYKKLYPHYYVHFTPDFKKDDKTGHSYDFYNKPRGLQHWLKYANPPIPEHAVIALLDPDMIFVRPLTIHLRGQPNNVYGKYLKESDIMEKVEAGKPAAQLYGLGAPWTNDNHAKFNRGHICGEGSPCLSVSEIFGERHYAVGPPYVVEKSDMQRIADTWTNFVPRVYEGYPYLLAEMYAYSMAAAHEKLPHIQFENFMVSNTDAGGEGWPLVDNIPDTCQPPNAEGIYYPDRPLPTVVHYCQNFRASFIEFAKRSANTKMFSCDAPLFYEPPADLGFSDHKVYNRKVEAMGKLQVKRNSFALCIVHRSINAALIDYKNRMCDPSKEFVNYNKTYIVHRK